MKNKTVDVAAIIAADVPMAISVAAKIFNLDKSKIKHATDEFKQSRGRLGLRCFTPPGASKVRVRPSAIHEWFAKLEDLEVS